MAFSAVVSDCRQSDRRVRETKLFPEWNPQAEFTSAEENSGFQGVLADGTRLFLPLSQLVEILISTKGAGFADTLKPRLFRLWFFCGKDFVERFCFSFALF